MLLRTEQNFIISSLNNHLPDLLYVRAIFMAKDYGAGTANEMILAILESSKIVSKLSGVFTKSKRMHKQILIAT